MGKKWKIAIVFVILSALCGCENQNKTPALVTQVQIECVHDGVRIQRSYTDPQRVSAVLDCLRLQRSKGRAQVDPERIKGDIYEIRVEMSDGSEHVYRHRGGQYLSKDSGPWQVVSREYGNAMYRLLWDPV